MHHSPARTQATQATGVQPRPSRNLPCLALHIPQAAACQHARSLDEERRADDRIKRLRDSHALLLLACHCALAAQSTVLRLGAHDASAPGSALDVVEVRLAHLDKLRQLPRVLALDANESTAGRRLLVHHLPEARLALQQPIAHDMQFERCRAANAAGTAQR